MPAEQTPQRLYRLACACYIVDCFIAAVYSFVLSGAQVTPINLFPKKPALPLAKRHLVEVLRMHSLCSQLPLEATKPVQLELAADCKVCCPRLVSCQKDPREQPLKPPAWCKKRLHQSCCSTPRTITVSQSPRRRPQRMVDETGTCPDIQLVRR